MFDTINIKIRLNIDREIAEELYDEIESYLALCFESVLERQGEGLELYSKLERIISATALTGFLIEKLGNQLVKVTEVGIFQDHSSLAKNFYVTIWVPNLWAASYGKDQLDERLGDALNFFTSTNSEVSEKESEKLINYFNGLPVNPLIGSVYYDQLLHSMKRWDGLNWCAV